MELSVSGCEEDIPVKILKATSPTLAVEILLVPLSLSSLLFESSWTLVNTLD